VTATILQRNHVTMRFLRKLGWHIDAPKNRFKSDSDGAMLEACKVSYTREAYRTFKQTELGQRILQQLKEV
jgi:hypothetical protein